MRRKRAETQAETIVLCLTKNMKKMFVHGDMEKSWCNSSERG